MIELEEKKPLDEIIFGNNKKKAGEARKFEMVVNLEGRSRRRRSRWKRLSTSPIMRRGRRIRPRSRQS